MSFSGLLLELCSSLWDSGYVGSEEREELREETEFTLQTLLIPAPLPNSSSGFPFPFPTAQGGSKGLKHHEKKAQRQQCFSTPHF